VCWIGQHTEYDISHSLNDPPAVELVGVGEVIRYEGNDFVVDVHLKAAYDGISGTIYLVLPWSTSSIRDQSTLLHELVHDVQFLNWPAAGSVDS